MAGEALIWQGNAPAVAQVSKFTVSLTWATNDTATLTCGSASVTFTVGGTQTIAAVVAGLVAAWNASAAPEIAEINATENSPDITLTMDSGGAAGPGIPFTVTASEVTAGDGTISAFTAVTANSGPNCYDTAANWSTGAVPVDSNNLIFEYSAIPCLWGIDQPTVTPDNIIIKASYTGTIGLPRQNMMDTSKPYVEYRPTYLKLCDSGDTPTGNQTNIHIGFGDGAGSGRIKLDTNTGKVALNIWRSGTRTESSIPCVLWKGSHVDNAIWLNRGDIGVAILGGESAAFRDLGVGYVATQATDAKIVLGDSVTHKASEEITINGGFLSTLSNIAELTVEAGDVTVGGTATVATLNVNGGRYRWNTTGLLTTVNLSDDGIIDFTGDMQGKIATNANVYGGTIIDPAGIFPSVTIACHRVNFAEVYQGPKHQDWVRTKRA